MMDGGDILQQQLLRSKIYKELIHYAEDIKNDHVRSVLETYCLNIGQQPPHQQQPSPFFKYITGMKCGERDPIVHLTIQGREFLREIIDCILGWTKMGLDASSFERTLNTENHITGFIPEAIPAGKQPSLVFKILDDILEGSFRTSKEKQKLRYDKYPSGVHHLKFLVNQMHDLTIQSREAILMRQNPSAIYNHISLAPIEHFQAIVVCLYELLRPHQMSTQLFDDLRHHILENIELTRLRSWEVVWSTTNISADKSDLLRIIFDKAVKDAKGNVRQTDILQSVYGPIVLMRHSLEHYFEHSSKTTISTLGRASVYLQNQFSDYLGVVMAYIQSEPKFHHLNIIGILQLRY